MKFKATISGNTAILKKLQALPKGAEQLVKDEIEATVMDIHREAVSLVPVDTGRLKGSLTPQVNGLVGEVGTNVKYAPYVEFGTGGKVNVPQGLETYASRYKGSGQRQVNLPARPYLFPAFFGNVPKMMARIQKGITALVK